MTDILSMHISEVSELIRKKELSPVEITEKTLAEIESKNRTNNSFITVCIERALADAKISEKAIMQGNYSGALHGIPMSIKDNISVEHTLYTSGSSVFKDRYSQNDAPVVERLRSNGAIIIGKTNLDEFANHVMGKNESYGTIKNPSSEKHTAGGSSGGSAASVAANLSYASLGTDTSGSVRIPAACCGLVGFKPSYNLIPSMGIEPLSWSLDHVGVLTKSALDASILFDTLVPGKKNSRDLSKAININELTIGIPENHFFESLDYYVETRVRECIQLLSEHGAKVKLVKVPCMDKILKKQEIIIGAEAAHYHKSNLLVHKDKFEKGNIDFLMSALSISDEEYYEALAFKQEFSVELQKQLASVDVLLTPTLPITAPLLNTEKIQWTEVGEEDVLDTLGRFTGPFNMSGLPALSIPVGKNEENISIGFQIVGKMYHEHQLLEVGKYIEGIIK